jgi:hypothetical protein
MVAQVIGFATPGGLQQGDPLSQFLFILVMEVLGAMIRKVDEWGLFELLGVTPDFNAKIRCSSYVCPGSSCHTYGQNVNSENQCLYYINIITGNIVFTQKTISTLSSSSSGTHQSHRQSTGGNASF